MAQWQDVCIRSPDFAERVQSLFDSRRHKVLATLRRDGSPRLSGIEVVFADGDVWIGSMTGSRKNDDLRRDPRLAIHVSSEDPPAGDPAAWDGDAKLAGTAFEVDDRERLRAMAAGGDAGTDTPEGSGQDDQGVLFRVEVTEAVLTRVAPSADHLLIEAWTANGGLQQIARY